MSLPRATNRIFLLGALFLKQFTTLRYKKCFTRECWWKSDNNKWMHRFLLSPASRKLFIIPNGSTWKMHKNEARLQQLISLFIETWFKCKRSGKVSPASGWASAEYENSDVKQARNTSLENFYARISLAKYLIQLDEIYFCKYSCKIKSQSVSRTVLC